MSDMDGGNEDPTKDHPESTTTSASRELEGGGDRALNCNSIQADTVSIESGKEEAASEEDERSSRLPLENALTKSETPETPDASITMLSASELTADVTAPVSENPKMEEESTLGNQNRQTSVQNEGEEVTLASKSDVVSTQEKPAAKGQGDRSTGGEGKGAEKSEWLDILGNGLLMKKTLRPGDGPSSRPTPQSRVRVKTKGVLQEGGQVVDQHSSMRFTVGDGDVIPAWDLAVSLMERGEIAKLKTDSRFAHGELGRPPNIPPNAAVTYNLELLEVSPPMDFQTITEEELISLLDVKRVRGNQLFRWKKYDTAINSYQRGLNMIQNYLEEQTMEASPKIQNLRIRFRNNLAATQLKVNLHREALESCRAVLKEDPENVKALFRAGKVLAVKSELDAAVKYLQKAATLDPEEKAIQVELQRALKKQEKSKEEEKAMYRRMVGGVGSAPPRQRATLKQQDSWGPLPYLAVAAIIAAAGIGIAYFITQRH